MIVEKCVFCDKKYKSTIDKLIDICPNCENMAFDDYDQPDFKDMVMTYSDEVLGANK